MAPPQSTSVSSWFSTPSPHAAGTHMFAWQTWLAQSAALLRATQLPLPSHTLPLFTAQVVPLARFVVPQVPMLQAGALQSMGVSMQSVAFMHSGPPPLPPPPVLAELLVSLL